MSRKVQEDLPLNDIGYTNSKHLTIFNQQYYLNCVFKAKIGIGSSLVIVRCDENQNGYITFHELENYINEHKYECNFIPKRTIEKIHKKADDDGDKRLSFDEFVELLENKDFQQLFESCVQTYLHHLVPHKKKEVYPFQLQSIRTRVLISAEEPSDFVPHEKKEVSPFLPSEEEPNLCDEYSCCPPPIFMFLISLIEFALFITDELTQKDSTLTASGITGKYLLYDPDKKKEFWRFLTYMFVHIGYTHIITNLIVQLALGIPLEMVNKWWRILTVYFLGGIAGCLAHSIIDGSIQMGGASGGVYALMTAHLAQVIMNWSDLPYAYLQFIIFGLLVTVDLGSAAYQRYYLRIVNEIGVTCHMGGALAGLLVGIYILRNVNVTNTEKYIWWAALVIYLLLMGAAILAIVFV